MSDLIIIRSSMRLTFTLGALAAISAFIATASQSAPTVTPAQRAKVLQEVVDCRKVSVDADRLACFDRATSALDEAEKKGEVVVVDKAQAHEISRQAFGFSLPSLNLVFRARGGEQAPTDLVTQVERGHLDANDRFTVVTHEGAVWRQTDDASLFAPKPGETFTVRPGALGSFFCKVGTQPAVRCKRTD